MALPIYFSDYVQAELVAAANASQTTILISTPTEPLPDLTVEAGAYTYITVVDQPSFIINQVPPTQREVMKLTAWTTVSSGLSLTVERGITTTAQIWASGSIMELRPCAQGLEDLKDVGTAVQAQYVVMAINAGLTSERVLTAGTNVTITDGGAKGAVTINSTGGSGATGATGATGSAGATGATGSAGGTGASGGVLQGQEFTSSGTFNVPLGITSLWLTMIGGGGGGSSRVGPGAGGGSGELVENLSILCVSEEAVTVTIGAAGAAGTASGAGGTGGTTSVTANGHTYPAVGGGGASGTSAGIGGGTGGTAALAVAETNCYFGGNIGGKGAAGYPTPAATGATSGGQAGGAGGANSKYGLGGAGGAGTQNGVAAASTSWGAGGGGCGGTASTANNGGAGAKGYVLIQWIGEP